MSEAAPHTVNSHKIKALELAAQLGGTHDEVVARANAYHSFLTDGVAPKAAAAAAPKATEAKPAAAAAKPAAAAAKPAAAAAKPAAAAKATPAAGTKPAAAAKPGAATPKAAAAKAADSAPAGDTKDAKGNNTFDDVKAALLTVMHSVPGDNDQYVKGKKYAYEVLAASGGGVKAVRDLKPPLYDAVVAACAEAAKKAAAAPKAKAAAKAETVVEDDLGQAIDTSGASAETAGADDPPEGGSGEDV